MLSSEPATERPPDVSLVALGLESGEGERRLGERPLARAAPPLRWADRLLILRPNLNPPFSVPYDKDDDGWMAVPAGLWALFGSEITPVRESVRLTVKNCPDELLRRPVGGEQVHVIEGVRWSIEVV